MQPRNTSQSNNFLLSFGIGNWIIHSSSHGQHTKMKDDDGRKLRRFKNYRRYCKRCKNIYTTYFKTSQICDDCCKPGCLRSLMVKLKKVKGDTDGDKKKNSKFNTLHRHTKTGRERKKEIQEC